MEYPNQQKKKIRAEITFKDLFDKYLNEYAKAWKLSWRTDYGYYNRYLISLDKKRVSDISMQDIERLHNKIKETGGLYAANRTLSLLSIIYSKAIDLGWIGNPLQWNKKIQRKKPR
jgi:hypothetical protein